MSHWHWVSARGKVIDADSPLAGTSRPRISGPHWSELLGETFSVVTTWPVLLVSVKFWLVWSPAGAAASPPAVLPPAGAAGAGAAVFAAAGAAALLVVAPLLQPAMASAEANNAPVR